jgi:hypothetical protein
LRVGLLWCLVVWPVVWALAASGFDPGVLEVVGERRIVVGREVDWRFRYGAGEAWRSGAALVVRWPHAFYSMRPANVIPQTEDPGGPGFVRLEGAAAADLELEIAAEAMHPGTVRIRAPRGLRAGATFEIVIAGCRAPAVAWGSFAPVVLLSPGAGERYEPVRVSRAYELQPGPAAQVTLFPPSFAARGLPVRVRLAIVDRWGNPVAGLPVQVAVESAEGRGLALLKPGPEGQPASLETTVVLGAVGVTRLVAVAEGLGRFESPPIRVFEELPPYRLVWGDPHGHSGVSDGMGAPEEYFGYARDVAGLDFAALSDHAWQISPEEWAALGDVFRRFDDPGSFVVLPAYEQSLGADHVVYLRARAPAPEVPVGGPKELWELELNGAQPITWTRWRGRFRLDFSLVRDLLRRYSPDQALAPAHTSASWHMGGDWDNYDPGLQPVVELYSAHGCSESLDCPHPVAEAVAHGTVRAALDRGYRLGFIAAGDSHDGHPGRTRWGAAPGGLTAVLVERLDREAILDAWAARRTYATSGHRPILEFSIDGVGMGGELVKDGEVELRLRAWGEAPFVQLDIVKNGRVWQSIARPPEGEEIRLVDRLDRPAYYYARWLDTEGRMAWTSPIRVLNPRRTILEHFSAQDLGGRVRVHWMARRGSATGELRLLRGEGNPGTDPPRGYHLLATIEKDGSGELIDEIEIHPGVTYYYVLEDRGTDGVTVHTGPVAAEVLPEAVFLGDQFRIGYYVPEPGRVRLWISTLFERRAFTLVDEEQARGYHEVLWDRRTPSGRHVEDLAFFEVQVGDSWSRRMPLIPDRRGLEPGR